MRKDWMQEMEKGHERYLELILVLNLSFFLCVLVLGGG